MSDYSADDIKVVDGWFREAALATRYDPEYEYADHLYNAEFNATCRRFATISEPAWAPCSSPMAGARTCHPGVNLFLRIDPYVRVIFTFSDGEPDKSYHQIEHGDWTAGEGGRRYADDGEGRSPWRPRGRLRHIASGLAVVSGELNTAQAAKGEKELRDIQWRGLRAAKPVLAAKGAL